MGQYKKAVQFSRTGEPSEVVEVIDMETSSIKQV